MNKVAIGFIIAGGVLVTVGCIALGVVVATRLLNPNRNMVTTEHVVTDSFENIDISTTVADVEFKASEDESCKVVCVEKEKVYHVVDVTNNTLTINIKDDLVGIEKWMGYGGNFRLTVYLPNNTYEDLKINISTGDTNIEGFNFTNVNIKSTTGYIRLKNADITNYFKLTASTGDIVINNMTVANGFEVETTTGHQTYDHVTCACDMTLKASTGRITLNNSTCNAIYVETSTGEQRYDAFVASGHLQAKASTGDITFKNSDAATLKINTSTGDVTGNLLTDKTFQTKTTTGRVNVPSTTGPVCNVETTAGDIIFTIGEK